MGALVDITYSSKPALKKGSKRLKNIINRTNFSLLIYKRNYQATKMLVLLLLYF